MLTGSSRVTADMKRWPLPFPFALCPWTFALSMQPHSQRRQQLLGVDRFREVVRRTGFEALLAVALHRLRGQSDDRQAPERRILPDLLHRPIAVHVRHHD